MKFIKIFVTCILIFTISACGGLSRKDTNAWLDEKSGHVSVNLTGEWDAGGVWTGGWGTGAFIQEGRNFSGTLGLYFAEGVVSEDKIYMVIFSGKKIYYTALLNKTGNDIYMGKVAEKAIVDRADARGVASHVITMKRKSDLKQNK